MARPRRSWSPLPFSVLIALALFFSACSIETSENSGAIDGAPSVLVTTSIWADVVANVACDGLADVSTLAPPGSDPHGFEPSLADRGRMERAQLIVVNGLGLEAGLEDTLDAVAATGVPVFAFGDTITPLLMLGDAPDPHVWFDPVRVSAALPLLADALVTAGIDRAALGDCLVKYQRDLGATDAAVAEILAPVPPERRKLITNHDALGYFADRYGFAVIGTVNASSSGLSETNPARLAELTDLVVSAGIPAVFAESQHSSDDMRAVADRADDVDVVVLLTGTLDQSDSGANSYRNFLLTNARLVADALS